MMKRFAAMVLMICCLTASLPLQALAGVSAEAQNTWAEPTVPPAQGDTGAEGILVEYDEVESAIGGAASGQDDLSAPVGTVDEELSDENSETAHTTLYIRALSVASEDCPNPEDVAVNTGVLSMTVGGTYRLQAVTEDGSVLDALWSTADGAIASVDGEGNVTANGFGETDITASVGELTAVCRIRVGRVAENVSFGTETLYMGVGETIAPGIIIGDGGEAYFDGYTLVSEKSKIVRVNKDGTLTGRKKGTATVTVTTENNVSDSLRVVVKKAPTKVTASPKNLVLGLGETGCLGYKLPSGAAGSASFRSLNQEIVSVDPLTGMVTAKAKGTAKIRITTYNGKTCTAVVKVVNAPESITLTDSDIVLGVGQVHKIAAGLSDGASAAIGWKSENTAVAVVENGRITALAPGETKITAYTYADGVSKTCNVAVRPAPEEVTLSTKKVYIGVGETLQLIPEAGGINRGFSYATGKKAYATVTKEGVVRGKKKGSATITVKAYNGKKATVKVIVGKAPSKITAEDMVIGLYDTGFIACSLPEGSYGSVKYESLTPEILSVDEYTGEMRALKTGEALVRIEAYNKENCTARVTVANAPEKVVVTPGAATLRVGGECLLTAETDEGAATTFTWKSSDTGIAAVDSGKLTATGVGTACITAYSHVDGVYGECMVTVTAAAEKLKVTPSAIRIGVGEEVETAVSGGEPVGSYSFSIEKSKYASVDDSGKAKGKAAGKTSLIVKSEDGQAVRIPITVGKKPSKITAVPSEITLGLYETSVLGYRMPKGCLGGVTFESLSGDIVSVDRHTGVLTANAKGTAEIVMTAYNGKTATAVVHVSDAPEHVSLSETEIVMGAGQKTRLEALVNDGAASAIRWESSDTSVADVENGMVTAKTAGTAHIRALTYVEGVYAACTVEVKPAPEKVVLPESKIYIGDGNKITLEPDVGESIAEFSYSSSRTKIAKVNKNGTVTGLRVGTAKITVKAYNGKKATVTVVVRKAPGKIEPADEYVRIGLGDSAYIGYKLPSKTTGTVTFETVDKDIIRVDSATGRIEALQTGNAEVILTTHNGKTAKCRVEVCPAPERVEVREADITLGVGQVYTVTPVIPEGSVTSFRYSVSGDDAVKVSEDGRITACETGTSVVRVDTCNENAWAEICVNVLPAPEYVRLGVVETDMIVDSSYVLAPEIPEESHTCFTYMSSDTSIATVSEEGVVQTRMKGEVFITTIAHNGKKADLKLNVFDPWYPEAVELKNRPGVLWAGGETYALEYTLTPENARPLFNWKSSDERVATVDQNGVITPLSYGYTTISAVSEKNPDVRISFTLAVQEEDRILEIPARTTDEAGIEENLEKIDAIRESAIAQVNSLRAAGKIKASDASKRKSMINNIFKNYAFPWKTPSFQKYWRSANSDGGAKHFRTDRVYYGMPYISGSGANRTYNVARALKEKRYTDSGNGYYLLNKKKLLDGRYVGNDCSGLVNTAIWGTSGKHIYDRTVEISDSKAYRTIRSFKSMRPGDLICLGYGHVAMFLYYADQDKTKVMVIENGGPEYGTNTVHCSVYKVSYYTKRGYKVRRLASLG